MSTKPGAIHWGPNASARLRIKVKDYRTTTADAFGIAVFDGANVDADNCVIADIGNRYMFDTGGGGTSPSTNGAGECFWVRNNARATLNNGRVSRGGNCNVQASRGSTIAAESLLATHASHHNVMATRTSHIYAVGGDFRYCLDDNVVAIDNSTICINSSDVSNAGTFGAIATNSSRIAFEDGICKNCKSTGVYANKASVVSAYGSTVSGNNPNFTNGNNSIIST